MIYEEQYEGFTVQFWVQPEEMDPADSFEFDEDIEAVRSGRVEWFMVQCIALKANVELAEDWLGGCAYEICADFLTPDGYAEDMRRTVVDAAKAKLAELAS